MPDAIVTLRTWMSGDVEPPQAPLPPDADLVVACSSPAPSRLGFHLPLRPWREELESRRNAGQCLRRWNDPAPFPGAARQRLPERNAPKFLLTVKISCKEVPRGFYSSPEGSAYFAGQPLPALDPEEAVFPSCSTGRTPAPAGSLIPLRAARAVAEATAADQLSKFRQKATTVP